MENIDPYIIEKQRAESPEDLLGRFLFRLVKLQNAGNQGLNGLNDRQYNRHIETQDLLSNVKKSIEDNKIDLSGLLQALSKIENSNSGISTAIKNIKFPKPVEKQKIEIDGISVITLKGDKGDKGEKGKDGYSPIKFKDYFTNDEVEKIVKLIEGKIKIPKDGVTPIAGKDYPTAKSIYKFLDEQIGKFPVPKNGKDGKDGNFPKHQWSKDKTQIRFENSDGNWGEWSAQLKSKDGRIISFGGGRVLDFLNLRDVPQSFIGKSGQVLQVNSKETALEFVTNGNGQVNSVVAGNNISINNTDPANPIITNTMKDNSLISALIFG